MKQTPEEMLLALQEALGAEAVMSSDLSGPQPWIELQPSYLATACLLLRDDPRFYIDFLECLSGVDQGPDADRMGIVYHLRSIVRGHRIVLKCWQDRAGVPAIPSVAHVWRTADWHEREAYDLLGIHIVGHPDLRRILMPEDWEGHPLRKDYVNPASYHDFKTAY